MSRTLISTVNSCKVEYTQVSSPNVRARHGLVVGANAWHLLCRFKKVHGLWRGGGLAAQIQVDCHQATSSTPGCPRLWVKTLPGDGCFCEGRALRLCLPATCPGRAPRPGTAALTELCLSVFKATPTLWQPMAAATPDSLLATAISSQVSGRFSRRWGNLGGGLYWEGGGIWDDPRKECSSL